MRHWIFKTEPGAFSWDDLVARGPAGEEWDGVRNYGARNHMREMAVGDLGLLYHSVDQKAAVGTVEVIAAAHPDSTDPTGRWTCVDIRARDPLPRPVTLAEMKAEPALAQMALIRQSRLSVAPLTPEEWAAILRLAGAA